MALTGNHNSGDVGHINDHNLIDTALSTAEHTTRKNQANGYAGLDSSGLLNPAQVPAIAITDTSVVASEGAMLALSAQVGDIAVRTDLSKTFILKTAGANILGNWEELKSPTDAVLSVDGRTGTVSLSDLYNSVGGPFSPFAAGANAAVSFVGGTSTSPPVTGTFAVGDFVVARNGLVFVCTVAGSPGTWITHGILGGSIPLPIGTATPGSSTEVARIDHVHAQQAAVAPTGLTGAVQPTRYVGATGTGAPSTGSFSAGDFVIAQDGYIWICISGGTPGTWLQVGANSVFFAAAGNGTTSASRYVGAVSGSAPASGTWVAGDFAIDKTNGGAFVCISGGSPGTWLRTPIDTAVAHIAGSETISGLWNYTTRPTINGQAVLDVADTTRAQTTKGGLDITQTIATSGSSQTLNLATANVFDVTLTANCTFTFSGATAGKACVLKILLRQDGTGNRTAAWPGGVVWAEDNSPVLHNSPNAIDCLEFLSVDGGTTWVGINAAGVIFAGGGRTITVAGSVPVTGMDGDVWIPTTPVTATDIGAIPSSTLGVAGGPASLNASTGYLESAQFDPDLLGGKYTLYGDGSDGNAVLDGANTFSWGSLSGSTYTLGRSVMFDNLTLNSGITINPGPHYIFVKNIFIWNNAVTNTQSNASVDIAASISASGELGSGKAGANGGTGVGSGGATNGSYPIGGQGKAGGSGGSGAGGGDSAGVTAIPKSRHAISIAQNLYAAYSPSLVTQGFVGGNSGGTGAGDGTNKGGAGGSGGNVIFVLARVIVAGAGATATAKGGNGGSVTVGNCGGGGGGGGGAIRVVYSIKTGSSITYDVSGGLGGTKAGTGTDGTNGNAGTAYEVIA